MAHLWASNLALVQQTAYGVTETHSIICAARGEQNLQDGAVTCCSGQTWLAGPMCRALGVDCAAAPRRPRAESAAGVPWARPKRVQRRAVPAWSFWIPPIPRKLQAAHLGTALFYTPSLPVSVIASISTPKWLVNINAVLHPLHSLYLWCCIACCSWDRDGHVSMFRNFLTFLADQPCQYYRSSAWMVCIAPDQTNRAPQK